LLIRFSFWLVRFLKTAVWYDRFLTRTFWLVGFQTEHFCLICNRFVKRTFGLFTTMTRTSVFLTSNADQFVVTIHIV
jgi:hypothetical protein